MHIAGIVSPSGIRSTGREVQLCLNIVVALPPKQAQLDSCPSCSLAKVQGLCINTKLIQLLHHVGIFNSGVYSIILNQISAKRGLDSRFVVEANTKSWWPKLSQSRKVKLMDWGRVTRLRVEYRVEYQVKYWILGEFLIIKVKLLLDSGNKS